MQFIEQAKDLLSMSLVSQGTTIEKWRICRSSKQEYVEKENNLKYTIAVS